MRPRILIVTFRPLMVPPVTGHALRLLEISRYLSGSHEVDLLYLCKEGAEPDQAIRDTGIFRRVFRFEYQAWQFGANMLRGVTSPLPFQVHAYTFSRVSRWLAERQGDYDAIFANFARVAEMMRGLSVPVLLDLQDAISLHYERASKMSNGLKSLLYRAEGERMRRYELGCIARFPLSLMVSEHDRDFLVKHGARADRLLAVPVPIPREVLDRPAFEGEEDDSIVFLGRMAYPPNRDAALFFARDVLPLIRRQAPKPRFIVVGAEPPAEVRALAEQPGIEVTGTVPDPNVWLERAKVVVAPMRYGAGMQNKVLQGLALRRAVVMSSLCAESLPGVAGRHYVVADDPEDLASATLACLRDPEARHRLGAEGRRLVERHFSFEAVGERIAAYFDRLIQLPRPA